MDQNSAGFMYLKNKFPRIMCKYIMTYQKQQNFIIILVINQLNAQILLL